MVQRLEKLGFTDARHLVGGWLEWETAGYPVEPISRIDGPEATGE